MIEQSLAHPAHPFTPYYIVEEIAAKAEAELERLRAARPALASRIDRAENIICRQLGSLKGYRPIRITLHPDGDHTYHVASDGKLGRSYTVNPGTGSCDCADYRRREAGCKHAIACWVIDRAYRVPAPARAPKVAEGAVADAVAEVETSLSNAGPLAVVTAGLERMSRVITIRPA